MTTPFRDEEKLREFFGTWPEHFVQDMDDFFRTTKGSIPSTLLTKLDVFEKQKDRLTAKFSDKRIENGRKVFVSAFGKLVTFLSDEAEARENGSYTYFTKKEFHAQRKVSNKAIQKKFLVIWEQFVVAYLSLLKTTQDVLGSKEAGSAEVKKGESQNLTLFLDQQGNLYRKPKKLYCYPMKRGSDRHKMFSHIARQRELVNTEEIRSLVHKDTKKQVMTEMTRMRSCIRKFLKIDGKKVIASKLGSGYGIAKTCKIRFE